jgi:hypothetical protein
MKYQQLYNPPNLIKEINTMNHNKMRFLNK